MVNKSETDPNQHGTSGRSSRRDQRVEEASIESFPASDPPAYTPSRSGDVDRQVHLGTGTDGVAKTGFEADPVHAMGSRWCEALSSSAGFELLDEMLAEDVAWRAGDGPLLVGKNAVREWQRLHHEHWGKVRYQLVDAKGDDSSLFIEAEVVRGGAQSPCHDAMSIRLREGRAVRVQLYGSSY